MSLLNCAITFPYRTQPAFKRRTVTTQDNLPLAVLPYLRQSA